MPWKKTRDPLFRGDGAKGCSTPDPSGQPSIVAHILYLDGPGRATPYHSTTESEGVAKHFAGRAGTVYRAMAREAEEHGVTHLSRVELMNLLRGKGKGNAKWTSALEVMTARKYVEQWSEHLLDFRDVDSAHIAATVDEVYES